MTIAPLPSRIVFLLGLSLLVPSQAFCQPNAAERGPSEFNSLQLQLAAAAQQSPVDKAFYSMAGRLRYAIDKQVFPPVGKGGNSPGVLLGTLGSVVGQSMPLGSMQDPQAQAALLERLSGYSPKFPDGYDPGWEYANRLDDRAAVQITKAELAKLVGPLTQQARLLENDDYRQLQEELRAIATSLSFLTASAEDRQKRETALASRGKIQLRTHELNWEINPESRWHAKHGWDAADYFEDSQAVALAEAIAANDLIEMRRLIDKGADVNAPGKDGMTLLLWALPDGKWERFEMLLAAGADPNVVMESDFGVRWIPLDVMAASSTFSPRCQKGRSITHLACLCKNLDYMRTVLRHSGDPGCIDGETGEAPLDLVIDRSASDRVKRVKLLIDSGAPVDRFCEYRADYPVESAARMNDYRSALLLLEAGAGIRFPKPVRGRNRPTYTTTLAHMVLRDEQHLPFADPGRAAAYAELVAWLQAKGADFDAARADLDRTGKLWGKALRRQRDQELDAAKAAQAGVEKQRLERLREIRVQPDADRPEPISAAVARLTPEQRARITLPKDAETEVFSYVIGSTDEAQESPVLSVKAGGRCKAGTIYAVGIPLEEGEVSPDELAWLMHLAVNEALLLDRRVLNEPPAQGNRPEMVFQFEVTTERVSAEVRFTVRQASKWRRQREPGAIGASELQRFALALSQRMLAGGEARIAEILEEVNRKLAEDHPELPAFRPWHLASALRLSEEKLLVGFERELSLGERRYEKVTGSYQEQGKEIAVRVYSRRYQKRR